MTGAERPVLVVGAGLAGLTAALHLAERGVRPLVLEADPDHAGGRLKAGETITLEHGGRVWHFAGEHGVHAVWSPYRNLQAMLVRHAMRPVFVPAQEETWLLLTPRRVKRAPIGSAIRESWIPAPLHYLGLFARPRFWAMLSPRDVLAMLWVLPTLFAALAIDPLAEDQPLQGMSLGDVTRTWSPNLTALFAGLSRNALPAHPDLIPASGFIAFLRFYTLARRDAWAFSYFPTDAYRALIVPLVERLREHGGELRLGACVEDLERAGEGWRVRWREGGEARSATCGELVLAVDAPAAEKLLQGSPATAPEAAGLRLPGGWPTAVVRLWFDRASRPGAEAGLFTGETALDNFFWLDRIYDDYIRWARATGGSAIESHIYGPPELLEEPDVVLLAHAVRDVLRVWPELRGHQVQSSVTRNPATHTLLRAGRPEEHLGVVTPWPRLFCCGDWVRDPNPAMFMERATITGIKAANAVLKLHDRPDWPLLPAPPPEALAQWVEINMRGVRYALKRRRKQT